MALVVLTAPAAALAQQAAPARAAPNNDLEEIVVTAQKRSENIQQVPIAVTAFTASVLQEKGIASVHDLSNLTPNVNLDQSSPFSGSNSVLSASIRGIGQDDFAFNLDPGVGVYVDGVYLARTVGANQNLMDVERVEILSGPQGTLFGRNTIGGAISIVTRTPSDSFQGRVQATTGSFDRRDFSGTVDIPFSDSLRASVTVASNERDGYQKRVPDPYAVGYLAPDYPQKFHVPSGYGSQNDAGAHNDQTVRVKLLWNASDDVKVTVTADWLHENTSATASTVLKAFPAQANGGATLQALYNLCIIGVPIPVCQEPLGPPAHGVTFAGPTLANSSLEPWNFAQTQTGDIDTSYASGANFDRLDSFGGSATAEWRMNDDLTLKSISGYRRLNWQSGMDADGSAANIFTVAFGEGQHQFSEELQAVGTAFDSRLNYSAGVYYFNEGGFIHDYPVFSGGLLQIDGNNNLDTSSYAAYSHVDYKVTDQIGLTIGARYSIEHKEFEGFQTDQNALNYKLANCFPVTPVCQALLGFPVPGQPLRYFPAGVNTQNFYIFNPTTGLQYHFTDDLMAYFSWSKGFKSGGWTTRLSTPIPNAHLAQFGPEKAETYEVGAKSEWLDRHLIVNWANFYTQYSDIQLNFQQGISPTLKNAGDAEILGSEVQADAILGGGLSLNGAAGYMDAYYTRLAPGTGIDSTNVNPTSLPLGTKLPKTPKWKVTLSPEYDYTLPNDATLRFIAEWTHTSSLFNDSYNTPELRRPTVDVVGLSLQYVSPDGQYDVVIGGTNITNERYITTGQNQQGGGIIYGTYNEPAEWYLTARFKFGAGQ
jgi:iron complex outermembrane receptor protein